MRSLFHHEAESVHPFMLTHRYFNRVFLSITEDRQRISTHLLAIYHSSVLDGNYCANSVMLSITLLHVSSVWDLWEVFHYADEGWKSHQSQN